MIVGLRVFFLWFWTVSHPRSDIQDHTYFACAEKHGVLVDPRAVKVLAPRVAVAKDDGYVAVSAPD